MTVCQLFIWTWVFCRSSRCEIDQLRGKNKSLVLRAATDLFRIEYFFCTIALHCSRQTYPVQQRTDSYPHPLMSTTDPRVPFLSIN